MNFANFESAFIFGLGLGLGYGLISWVLGKLLH